MAITWTKLIPRWGGDTIEPPEAKKDTGYIAGDKPPAKWENWLRKGTYEALDETRDVIENIDSQLAQDALNLSTHKAEDTSQFIAFSRDLSLTGVQTITTLNNRKIRSIHAIGTVNGTKKQSIGLCGLVGGGVSYTQPTTGNYAISSSSSAANLIGFSDDTTANRTFGTAKNFLNGSFDIDWTRIGSGATGTANLGLLITYHGEA